jgi:hypothetical protein
MLTAERLREVLAYNTDTGVFTWRERRGPVAAGQVAGSGRKDGYRETSVDGRPYLLHRLAFMYVHGRWPVGDVDHIDRNRTNNAAANLREATRAQNNANSRRRLDNRSGHKGVVRHQNGWRARIRKDGRQICLGVHPTPEAAAAAYRRGAAEHFGEFARGA